MESYAAYENYEDGMELYEAMIKYVAEQTWGTLRFNVGGFEVDLDQEYRPHVKYADLLMDKFGIDVFQCRPRKSAGYFERENGASIDPKAADSRLLDNLWKLIRKTSVPVHTG